ncbi:unnamed protein product [Bursaphelenchus okinawaensis]|uniref:Uncharacterized protein n=1 Tax=Bursaphelenchus okinawaensis TaxID=465554 RepID=A0A811LQ59_9BILA|nr:unnamed protein product [Bursaphelenchus okinawaensis]CAG9127832.1 unnamed protein product [Bursaphelenchus okinawaensis]
MLAYFVFILVIISSVRCFPFLEEKPLLYTGKVIKHPPNGTTVIKLWEKHFGKGAFISPDVLLATVPVKADGSYSVQAMAHYYFSLDTYMEIFHSCGSPCRIVTIESERNISHIELLNAGKVQC